MSDGAAETPLWMPDLGDMPAGPVRVLVWLVLWRDGRGSCDPTNAELCKVTKLDESTVRKHTGWLEREGWAKRERRRREDGSLGGWRYWLNLEKLDLGGGTSRKHALPLPAVSPVDSSAEAPPENQPCPPENEGGMQGGKTAGAQKKEGGKTAGVEEPGARAGAEVSLPSSSHFLSFPWRDDVTRIRAAEILDACGPMIGRLGDQRNRVLLSLAYVLEPDGLWAPFDHVLDVLPVVKAKTGPGRRDALWDFALLVENLEKHQARRLRPMRDVKPKAEKKFVPPPAPVVDPEQQRVKRMAVLRNEIAIIDRGERPTFLLPRREQAFTGEFLEDAFQALRRRNAEELAGLEMVTPANTVGG